LACSSDIEQITPLFAPASSGSLNPKSLPGRLLPPRSRFLDTCAFSSPARSRSLSARGQVGTDPPYRGRLLQNRMLLFSPLHPGRVVYARRGDSSDDFPVPPPSFFSFFSENGLLASLQQTSILPVRVFFLHRISSLPLF